MTGTFIVWAFVIFGPTASSVHQFVDNFPTKQTCERFRKDMVRMSDMGVFEGRVSDCTPRSVVRGAEEEIQRVPR